MPSANIVSIMIDKFCTAVGIAVSSSAFLGCHGSFQSMRQVFPLELRVLHDLNKSKLVYESLGNIHLRIHIHMHTQTR